MHYLSRGLTETTTPSPFLHHKNTLLYISENVPFPVPDPISVYEQTQYANFQEYRNSVIVPEMLIKLRQGFGRLIRTETDTGVVAILDSRVGKNGSYRECVLDALPSCRMAVGVDEVWDCDFTTRKFYDYL